MPNDDDGGGDRDNEDDTLTFIFIQPSHPFPTELLKPNSHTCKTSRRHISTG